MFKINDNQIKKVVVTGEGQTVFANEQNESNSSIEADINMNQVIMYENCI